MVAVLIDPVRALGEAKGRCDARNPPFFRRLMRVRNDLPLFRNASGSFVAGWCSHAKAGSKLPVIIVGEPHDMGAPFFHPSRTRSLTSNLSSMRQREGERAIRRRRFASPVPSVRIARLILSLIYLALTVFAVFVMFDRVFWGG